MRTLIIGCGNLLRGDDAAGPVLVRRMWERGLPDGVRCVDGGTGGMDVAFQMRGVPEVILVDACSSGSEPGSLFEVPGHEVENLPPLTGINLHAFRWDHAIAFGHWLLKDDYPANVTAYLIEGERYEIGDGLSPAVDAAVDRLVDLLLAKVGAEPAKPAEPAAKPVEIAKRPDIEIKKLPSMSPEEMEARRNKIRDIYKLGDEPTEENAAKLKAMISDDTLPPHERSAAVRAISRTKRDDMIEVLKGFADAKELNVAAEAVITLYRWGEKEFALPKLEALQKKGVPLRRAFFLGRQDGNYVYDDNAKDFFTKGIEAIQPHVKLDAALGLLHLGQMDVALPLFKAAMEPSEKNYVRLTALNYLAGASYLPEVDQILFAALSDPDPKVAARARQIVGPRTEPRQAVPQDPAAAKAKADELPQPSTEPESGAPAEAAPAPVVEVAPAAAAPAAAPAAK